MFYNTDVDLGGTAVGDVVAPLEMGGNRRTWTITDGAWTSKVTGFNAIGSGAGGFSAIGGQMTDTGIDNFVLDLNPGGLATPSDYAHIHQWRYTIGAGETVRAAAANSIGRNGAIPAPVPEPATMAILGLGVAALARRRRR